MNFTLLRTFHAVAEQGGFTRAATALSISQPTVTIQIKELEKQYGVELFLRHGRRVELTSTGRELLEITRRIMHLSSEADELLTSHGGLRAGTLRLAAVGPFHATTLIADFRRAYPDMEISVLLGNSWQTMSHLLDLQADVAILAHAADDPKIETVPYSTHNVVIFVNRSHEWFGRRSVRLHELSRQSFVLREKGSTTRLGLERALADAGIEINAALEIGSREGVWKAVEQGLGISAVADFEFVAHPNLHTLEIEDCRVQTEYRIAFLRERSGSWKIRAFLETVGRRS
jgi:LysR family transcriptional regulator, low CO2-responsive transcriptional regulator